MIWAWILGGAWAFGALITGVFGWFALRIDERPYGFMDWILWGAYCIGWVCPAIAGIYSFLHEDSED